ncbi:hypothetical protein ACOBR2_11095 [Telmatobacter bradus]|uniref:hypothetical protein n=1 Tax=Telmatobacter bradus TaxID=474953 RepID=UPI003B432356
MNRFRRILRFDSARGWQSAPPAVRTMAPTLFALSIAGVAHDLGTMDFSGATTLLTT